MRLNETSVQNNKEILLNNIVMTTVETLTISIYSGFVTQNPVKTNT